MMKLFNLVVIIALAAIGLASFDVSETFAQDPCTYEVQEGDNLRGIAESLDVDWEALAALNNITRENVGTKFVAGLELTVPDCESDWGSQEASGDFGNEVATESPDVQVTTDTQETGLPTFSVSGAPSSVQMPPADAPRTNTLGLNTEHWVAEPGVLTADPGDQNCKQNASCWTISPDNQYKLTDPESEAIDLREDAWVFMTFAGGTLEIEDVTITLDKLPLMNWTVILRGKNPGAGDLNTQVIVTGYDASFALATNLPVGARVSEDYVLQNVNHTYERGTDVCGGGCENGNAILMFNVNNGGWTAIYQTGPNQPWVQLGTNISN